MDQQFETVFERGEEILRVENLSCGKYFQNVSFSLHKGEVWVFRTCRCGSMEVAKTIFETLPKQKVRFVSLAKKFQ